MQIVKEMSFFFVVFLATALAGCPQSHPYAYLNGWHCCKTEKEANRPYAGDNPPCDGSRLGYKSRCCEGDRNLACPGGRCKTAWDDRLTAGLTYPLNSRYVCYVNGELAKIIPFDPDDEFTGAFTCRDLVHLGEQLTEDGDHMYEEWEFFNKSTSEWEVYQANVCWWEDAQGYVDCLGVFSRHVVAATSTGGSARAKARPPQHQSCGRRGVGKWKRIRGRLRCVFVPICPGWTVSQADYVWVQGDGYSQRRCKSRARS